MKKSNVFHIISNLPTERRRSLRKFIHSPFHNLRGDVKNLFLFLEKNTAKDLPAITFANAHAAAYPGQAFDMQQLRYCMSYLMKAVEKYLTVQEATADPLQNQLHLSNAYRKLGLEKHTRRALEKASVLQSRSRQQDLHFYEKKYQLEAELYAYSEGMKRTAPRNLQQVNLSLDLAFLAKKLKHSCLALSHGAVANVEYDSGLLDLVLGHLENADWLESHPAISLYFYYYQAATKGGHSYFEKLKKGILEKGGSLPGEELRTLYLLAINYCIQRFNKGGQRYLPEVFDLYKAALENGILLENGLLSRFAFKNIAGIAIRLEQYAWTEVFIKKYSHHIAPRHRRNYTSFNLAKLHYARKEFGEAMQLLQKVEYEDVFLNLDAKMLLLKIYFEMDEMDVLDSFISSFQRFLQRKKALGYHRENYLGTLQFARRLITLNPFNKKEKEELKTEIEETKALGEKEWLLKQL
ncbi:MAG TPA: hypothetical protein ENJ95_02195 [Bacteroidetes bacterium]|nr:hypothetical protein [Bacteroidota bacterium]